MSNIKFNKVLRGIRFMVTAIDGGYSASVQGISLALGPFDLEWFAKEDDALSFIRQKFEEHEKVA